MRNARAMRAARVTLRLRCSLSAPVRTRLARNKSVGIAGYGEVAVPMAADAATRRLA